MNINDDPKRLKTEEQAILKDLISQMDKVLKQLDKQMQKYVVEAKNAKISLNLDLYLSQLLAQKGIRDTEENRQKFFRARDELYHTRLLLQYREDTGATGVEKLNVGLHSCNSGGKQYVISWKMPLCRHYMLDNASIEYDCVVDGKFGEKYHTYYTMLVKNQVTLRFTRVVKAMNLFPGIFDDTMMRKIKGTGFFSDSFLDEMISNFDPDEYNPDEAAKIISDEFLQELLERRSNSEFKNIVFSIQKKQGEIIQAPYKKNMLVQGCAGSGKSMIMLHRLPILLYDHPDSLERTNLYIITPSEMYIQLAENMRSQLEISDINMGTIEEYYDFCISRYAGHKAREYGKISYSSKLSSENEKYIYSSQCIRDIEEYFESLCNFEGLSLDKAFSVLKISSNNHRVPETYEQKMARRSRDLQDVLTVNNNIIAKYFCLVREVLDGMYELSANLRRRKGQVIRKLRKEASTYSEIIEQAQKDLEKMDPEKNVVAIKNRNETIQVANVRIDELSSEIIEVDSDNEYFDSLLELCRKLENALEPFKGLKASFSENTAEAVYQAVDQFEYLVEVKFMLTMAFSKIEDKYSSLVGPIDYSGLVVEKVEQAASKFYGITDQYIDFEYYSQISKDKERITEFEFNAVRRVYELVMGKIGVKPGPSGNMRALKCSPYIYLQILYLYQGVPALAGESLLAIDEVQSLAPEEIRLLKNVNGNKVIFNMYGDIYQHIEGTKGVDSWDEYAPIIDYEYFEIQENYRNASQITEYCNRTFGMKMIAINTPGKGVHVIRSEQDFHTEMLTQLMDTQRAGLAAILVGNIGEAQYLKNEFSAYGDKLHDMTDEDFSIHRTKWNIITIDDAKGLEFSTVIALSGRMTRNQKYIAYTRALDDLYIFDFPLDTATVTDKMNSSGSVSSIKGGMAASGNYNFIDNIGKHDSKNVRKSHENSEVRSFFEKHGLDVMDMRDTGGRLWVIGEKTAIRDVVNKAISKFGISGKYASSKDIKNKNGWCTKTDK